MAAAGIAGSSMNYFTPAAAIRAFAILRTGGRYAERLVTHEATLRFLSGLRVWFYRQIEPLPVAALQHYRGGDLLSRVGADIDALPLADEKNVPYRSTVANACHACGHDVHTTVLLGTGLFLAGRAAAGPPGADPAASPVLAVNSGADSARGASSIIAGGSIAPSTTPLARRRHG